MKPRRAVYAVLTAILSGSVLSSCAYFDPRAILDPQNGFAPEVYLLGPGEEPADVTGAVCGEHAGCERAAESARVRIIRFGGVDDATTATGTLGDSGYRSDRFVIEFLDDTITEEQRRMIESTVDHTATASPD